MPSMKVVPQYHRISVQWMVQNKFHNQHSNQQSSNNLVIQCSYNQHNQQISTQINAKQNKVKLANQVSNKSKMHSRHYKLGEKKQNYGLALSKVINHAATSLYTRNVCIAPRHLLVTCSPITDTASTRINASIEGYTSGK